MTPKLLQDIIQWDVKNWAQALVFWEGALKEENRSKKLRCLEIGSREGGLSLWLAMNGHDVICSDVRNSRAQAVATHEKYEHPGTITYEDINALAIPYTNAFDVIVFKSVLGGISTSKSLAEQRLAIEQMHKALLPGGKLLFAENLKASRLHKLMRYLFIPHSSQWRYVGEAEMEALLQPFRKRTVRTAGVLGVLGRSEILRNALSGLDRLVLNKICPSRWHYIIYGVAEK